MTAPGALARTIASSSPTLSDGAPPPGLSWVSASTTGFEAVRAIRIALATASSGDHSLPAKAVSLRSMSCSIASAAASAWPWVVP